MNLISNASGAISGGGMVTIATKNRQIATAYSGYEIVAPSEYALLSMSDDGQGIPAESLERIFEPFYTKKAMGRSVTGIGLAVVWGTVKDNGGYGDVSSIPRQGTRFDLYYPRTDQVALEQDAASLDGHQNHGEHLLVVDNVAEQRIIASSYSETQRVSAALDLGAARYLKKPYTLFELANAVGNALKGPPE